MAPRPRPEAAAVAGAVAGVGVLRRTSRDLELENLSISIHRYHPSTSSLMASCASRYCSRSCLLVVISFIYFLSCHTTLALATINSTSSSSPSSSSVIRSLQSINRGPTQYTTKPWDFRSKYSRETTIWGERSNEMYGSAVAVWNNLMLVGAWGDKSREVDTGAVYLYERSDINNEHDRWKMSYVLHPEDGYSGDQYGYAVSLNDHIAVVGAPRHDVTGEDSGAAYLYDRMNEDHHLHRQLNMDPRNHLTLVTKLTHPYYNGSTNYFYFGSSVAVHINTTVIGAWNCQNDYHQHTGCAFVWRRSRSKVYDGPRGEYHYEDIWYYAQRLLPLDGFAYTGFGTSVSIYENVIAVGAPTCVEHGSFDAVGCVFIFETRSSAVESTESWQLTTQLHPPNGKELDRFGESVKVWKRNLLVGSPYHELSTEEDGDVVNAGIVYSYYHDTWGDWDLIQQIRPHRPLPKGHFGHSLDLYENVAAIGAYNSAIDGSGSVDIFHEHLDTEDEDVSVEDIYWTYHTTRSPENEIPGDMFGYSVSVYYSTLVVGAYGASLTWEHSGPEGGPDRRGVYLSGGVYVYTGHQESTGFSFMNVNFEQNIVFTSVLFVLLAGLIIFLTVVTLTSMGCISERPANRYPIKPRTREWRNSSSSHGLMQSTHEISSHSFPSYHDLPPDSGQNGLEMTSRGGGQSRGGTGRGVHINQ